MNKLLIALLIPLISACGKADIIQDCRINGLGDGSCSFTNTGDATGSVCITPRIVRTDGDSIESSLICSGKVAPSSTTVVEFFISDLLSFCTKGDPTRLWTDSCDLQSDRREEPENLGARTLARFIDRNEKNIRICESQINTLQNALTTYTLDAPQPSNLRVLTVGEGQVVSPSTLIDPWGNVFIYRFPSRRPNLDYDLCSAGPDKRQDTKDDVCNESD